SDHIVGHGQEFFAHACQLGLEGIISKRADAGYRSGRGRNWLKVKCSFHEEFVVVGFTDPAGGRKGFGSLLLGAHDGGELVYAGRVGTGFSDRQLQQLHRTLRGIEVKRSALDKPPADARNAHWVKPQLVAEVEFTERTRDGRLRHPTFRGLREDKDAAEIDLPTDIAVEDAMDASLEAVPARASGGAGRRRVPGEAEVAGIRITHPER